MADSKQLLTSDVTSQQEWVSPKERATSLLFNGAVTFNLFGSPCTHARNAEKKTSRGLRENA